MVDILSPSNSIPNNEFLRSSAERISETFKGDNLSVLYFSFPQYKGYEDDFYAPSAIFLSQSTGLVCVFDFSEIDIEDSESFISLLHGRLLKSPILRKGPMSLSFEIRIVGFSANEKIHSYFEYSDSAASLFDCIIRESDRHLSHEEILEIRSILEGAKALSRPKKREVSNAEAHTAAAYLARLEAEISNFDQDQRRVALSVSKGPQRIRGLAGSGKTVILAMKAAHLHLHNPESRILVTYYTKSLHAFIKSLISRFYRHYSDEDPNWEKLEVMHAWGGQYVPGVYYNTAIDSEARPKRFNEAPPSVKNQFDWVCSELISSHKISPKYDAILIDEGQDLPSSFYKICYDLAKGIRNQKTIIWAYDELQNIFDVGIRNSDELFGLNSDGEPNISITRERSHGLIDYQSDIVLPKCYRNQRDVLVVAHALGFGVYDKILQMLEGEDHWRDVGYDIINKYEVGKEVDIVRPDRNSPTSLDVDDALPLISYKDCNNYDDEIDYIVGEIHRFLEQGLQPEDIMVICLDDRNAKGYFSNITRKLIDTDININNLLANQFGNSPFREVGSITLTTVHRAKGNESAVVICCGLESINRNSLTGRNRLFTAFTRTKGWLRLSGISPIVRNHLEEIGRALENTPHLKFVVPPIDALTTIQRDLSDRDIKIQAVRRQMAEKLRKIGLSETEIEEQLGGALYDGLIAVNKKSN